MIVWRQCDTRYPFIWESDDQPAARWHADGEGPVQYFADSSDGAWCEFVRHEEITDLEDLAGVRRAIWVVEIGDIGALRRPALQQAVLTGGMDTYSDCQREARSMRRTGASGLVALSAALLPGRAGGLVEGGLRPGPDANGRTVVLFGPRPDLLAWKAADEARPPEWILSFCRYL